MAGSAPTTTTFIFAGGGTGGHLFPGLAIAEALEAGAGGAGGAPHRRSALFLCSSRPLDARILSAADQPFQALPARPFSIRPRGLVRFLSAWAPTVRQTRAAIGAARADGRAVHLVAMGGFVAAPAVQAARVERVPITLV